MKQNFKQKLMAGLLSVCMIFQTVGIVPVYAVGNAADSGLSIGTSSVCTHHVHDDKCGYTEGTPCTHVHTDECNTEVTKCVHEHTADCYPVQDSGEATGSDAKEPTACTHQCSAESGCITKELACKHVHDNACGYTEGTPCTFDTATCESCNPKNTVDNRAALAGEVYAVWDGTKFYAATAEAPSTATSEEITDKNTINHLYIMGSSVPNNLIGDSNATIKNTTLKTVTCADTVITIGRLAFKNCKALTSVTMASATTIGSQAFYSCTSLASVTMPNVSTIGTNAFWSCTNLVSVKMSNVSEINMYAFYNCAKLTSAQLSKVSTISTYAFSSCASLTNVVLSSATSIDDNAFSSCTSLASVEMPKVTKIGTYAFNGCTSLASLTLGATPPATVGTDVFTGCPASRTLTIQCNPDSQANAVAKYKAVEDGNTGDELWYGWTLPNTINEVYAVYDGSKFCAATADAPSTATAVEITDKKTINNLYIMGASVPANLMSSCTALTSVEMPSATTIGDSAFNGCTSLASVTMPYVSKIGMYAFYGCTKLASVTMLSATTIGSQAFYGCTKLASVEMPVAATIGDSAFDGCTSLASVTMPSATTIGNQAFWHCTSLASVAMPKATKIGDNAFNGCTKLTSLTLGATPPAIVGTDVFTGCPASRTLTIQCTSNSQAAAVAAYKAVEDGNTGDELWYGWTLPNTINEVYAVYDGSGKKFYVATADAPTVPTTTEITDKNTINNLYIMGASVPKGLMGDWQNPCPNLKTVICADTVTTIGTNAFQKCTNLASVDVSGATAIGDEAFSDCTSLTSLAMPNATTIGKSAFSGCANLTSVEMPKVTSIDPNAFYNCASLASLTLGATPPATVGTDVFTGCPKTNALTIQGNPAFKDTVIAAYKAVNDGATDELWYGWTLPTALDGSGVSNAPLQLQQATLTLPLVLRTQLPSPPPLTKLQK